MAQESETGGAGHYGSPRFVVKKIGDEEIEFYSVSVKAAFELTEALEPLLQAAGALWGGIGQENGGKQLKRRIQQADGSVLEETEDSVVGMDFKLAEVKTIDREKAIHRIVTTFTNVKNQRTLVKFVMASMRKKFPTKKGKTVEDSVADEFMADTPVEDFQGMVVEALKRNMGALGPLGARLVAMAKRLATDPSDPDTSEAERSAPKTDGKPVIRHPTLDS